MPENKGLTEKLQKLSKDYGADLFGVAYVDDFSEYKDKRSPFFYLDNAKSVIVIGYHLSDPLLDVWIQAIKEKREYYFINEILGTIALEIINVLLKEGKRVELVPYSGVYSKNAAVLANLGTIGKNNLLITDRFGPRVRLRTIVTDAELTRSFHKPKNYCEECDCFCWTACPANAFATGQYDVETCARYSEEHVKWLSDNAFLYCRKCETACPVGQGK
jgi:epoxyqueuosine reductase